MNSRTTAGFRRLFAELPKSVQVQAREAYRMFLANPSHPGLRFKRVHPVLPIYSARISRNYRAVGTRSTDEIVWFWIGPHSEYEKILAG